MRGIRPGAPFKDWVLPAALERVPRKLAGTDDGDRQMVAILASVLGHDWFLSGKYWTNELARASQYINVEAASAALATARRNIKNKQSKARIVATAAGRSDPILRQT